MKLGLALGVALVVVTTAVPAAAQNLVANPGFTTGNFTSWTNEDGVNNQVAATGRDGTGFRASLGSFATPLRGINQNITTVANQNYTFSFWVRGDGTTTAEQFQAFFGGNSVYNVTDPAIAPINNGYVFQSFNVRATSTTTNIRFAVNDQNNFVFLDDVSVVLAAAPEPATWGLMILGFGLVGASLRRRRRPLSARMA